MFCCFALQVFSVCKILYHLTLSKYVTSYATVSKWSRRSSFVTRYVVCCPPARSRALLYLRCCVSWTGEEMRFFFSMSQHNGLVFFPEISFITTRMSTIHLRLYFHFLKNFPKGAGNMYCLEGSRSESVPMTSLYDEVLPGVFFFAGCSEEFRDSSTHNSH